MNIVVGERYKRRVAPRDYAWVTSFANGSVGYRRSDGGMASIPAERFERAFEASPKRKRGE